MTTLTREQARQLGEQAEKFLASQFAGKAIIKRGSASFDKHELRIQFVITPGNLDDAKNNEREKFAALAYLFDLTPEHYGAFIIVQGKPLKICGIDVRKRRFPIQARSEIDGKVWVITVDTAKRAIISAKADGKKSKAPSVPTIKLKTPFMFSVGQKVWATWDDDEQYKAVIMKVSPKTPGKYFVRAEDGDEIWLKADKLIVR